MNLSDGDKVGYSKFERRVFTALKIEEGRSTTDITDEIYRRKDRPFNARQTVLGALVSLSKKVKANREPFAIKRSKRQGPHPVDFWIE